MLTRLKGAARSQLLRLNAIYFVGSLLTLSFGYIYHFASGRLLGPTAYAPVAATFSLYFLLLVPGQLALTVAMRHAALLRVSGQSELVGALLRYLTRLTAIASMVMTGLFVVATPFLARFLRTPQVTVLALAPAVSLILLTYVSRGILQGEQRFRTLSAVMLIDAAAKVVFAIALIRLGAGAGGAVLALGIGLALSYGASLWPLRSQLTGSKTVIQMRDALRFVGPATAAVAGVTVLYTVDVLLVNHFFDARPAGIYGSVSALGRVVFMATASITGVMFPLVTSLETQGHSSSRALQLSAGAIAIVAGSIVALFAFASNAVIVPFGPAFVEAKPYLPAFAVVAGLFSLINLLSNYLLAIDEKSFVPVLAAAALGETIAILNFHADLWQVISCLLAVGSMTVVVLWTLYLLRRHAARA